jgi:hypothetical protein
LAGLLLAASSARADSHIIFEVRHHGGYGPRDPDPYVLLRVHADGLIACHCPDSAARSRWVEGRAGPNEVEQLREEIEESGFLSLRGGLSRWQAWWQIWQSDVGVTLYFARLDGRKRTYRRSMAAWLAGADEHAPIFKRLEDAAERFRKRLCGSSHKPSSE